MSVPPRTSRRWWRTPPSPCWCHRAAPQAAQNNCDCRLNRPHPHRNFPGAESIFYCHAIRSLLKHKRIPLILPVPITKKTDSKLSVLLCWHYLSFRPVSRQVFSAEASLTSVFGWERVDPRPNQHQLTFFEKESKQRNFILSSTRRELYLFLSLPSFSTASILSNFCLTVKNFLCPTRGSV